MRFLVLNGSSSQNNNVPLSGSGLAADMQNVGYTAECETFSRFKKPTSEERREANLEREWFENNDGHIRHRNVKPTSEYKKEVYLLLKFETTLKKATLSACRI